ncbi:hypothetical protein ACLOJK_034954, partial [Asimina triloba]
MVGWSSAEHRWASLASSGLQAGTRGRRRANNGSRAESGCWGPPEATCNGRPSHSSPSSQVASKGTQTDSGHPTSITPPSLHLL